MTEHLSIDELLALRDADAGPWARTHIEECEACQEAFDGIGQQIAALRALPVRRPPRDRWPVVRDRFVAERRRRRWRKTGWGSFAAAAGLAMAVGLQSLGLVGGSAADDTAVVERELHQLVDESRQLEAALAEYGTDGRVLSGRTAGLIVELEDRIAMVDAGISQRSRAGATQQELITMWRDRVQLMGALVNTHVTRAAYVGF